MAWLGKSCSGEQKCSVHMITGFTNILFSTLGVCCKVDNIVLQLVLHISLVVAPDADFAICLGVIILQVLHLALPHGRVSTRGSSSRMSGLSLARSRRSRILLGLL